MRRNEWLLHKFYTTFISNYMAFISGKVHGVGIKLGTANSHSINWLKVISKIRSYTTNNQSTHLTLNGQILLANACITSQTIFVSTHQHAPIEELKKVVSAINTFTNPSHQSHSYISFTDKTKPHENGGPLTTLLDPTKLCPLQSTKWIYEIVFKYPTDMDQFSWHSEWVDTIMNYVVWRKSTNLKICSVGNLPYVRLWGGWPVGPCCWVPLRPPQAATNSARPVCWHLNGGPSAQGGTPTHFENVPEAAPAARGVPGPPRRARLYACRGWVRPRHI